MTRTVRNLAATALGFAILSYCLVWMALDPEVRATPVLAIPAGAMFLLAPLLASLALIFGNQARKHVGLDPASLKAQKRPYFRISILALGLWALALILLVPLLARTPRGRARDRAALWNLENGLADLAVVYGDASRKGLLEPDRLAALEALLASQQDLQNPWRRGQPGLRPQILNSGTGEAAAKALAEQQATTLGQVVFVLSAPSGQRWLAGAVRMGATGPASAKPPVTTLTTPLEP